MPPAPSHPGEEPRCSRYPRAVSEPSVAEVTPAHFSEIKPRVARIDAAARAADGHPALGDAVWLDLDAAGVDSAGYFVDEHAYAHVARGDNAVPRHWILGLAVAPEARGNGDGRTGVRAALVAAAAKHVAAHGGGTIALWVLGIRADDGVDADLRRAGMHPDRELYEMRVALSLGQEPKWPPGVQVRTFRSGNDDAEWIAVNNRAFAGHAEQGGWTEATLARRIAEPWFDPTLFFLAHDADGLVGFNWLKIHEPADDDPRIAEIYVIGVDPRGQGTGLGRALAVAGLNAAHERGIDTGSLFVAADNEPALRLYRSLGFDVHRTDRAYEYEVPAA